MFAIKPKCSALNKRTCLKVETSKTNQITNWMTKYPAKNAASRFDQDLSSSRPKAETRISGVMNLMLGFGTFINSQDQITLKTATPTIIARKFNSDVGKNFLVVSCGFTRALSFLNSRQPQTSFNISSSSSTLDALLALS